MIKVYLAITLALAFATKGIDIRESADLHPRFLCETMANASVICTNRIYHPWSSPIVVICSEE
jgi:hypothetical protein